jgi:hypothetical protein
MVSFHSHSRPLTNTSMHAGKRQSRTVLKCFDQTDNETRMSHHAKLPGQIDDANVCLIGRVRIMEELQTALIKASGNNDLSGPSNF